MITVNNETRDVIRDFLEEEYERRTVGNRTLEQAFVMAMRSAPVREAVSGALDIFIHQIKQERQA